MRSRELYRKQEELGRLGPGVAYANQHEFSASPQNKGAHFGTARRSHERHLWRKQEECAAEVLSERANAMQSQRENEMSLHISLTDRSRYQVPGAGTYDIEAGALTSRGLARRSSCA